MRATGAVHSVERSRRDGKSVVASYPMHRAQSILLILALLATPLALLARGIACAGSDCDMACCRMHMGPSASGMSCSHCDNLCGMKTHNKALDFGFIAPMAPTIRSAHAALALPSSVRQNVLAYRES